MRLLGEYAMRRSSRVGWGSGRAWEIYAKEEIFGPVGMVNSSFDPQEYYSPGSAARGPARELGRFYEMLLRRGIGTVDTAVARQNRRIILPQTVEALTARHR